MALATIKFKKLSDRAIIPEQKTDGSVGFDLAVLDRVAVLPKSLSSKPYTARTGIAMELPKGYYGEIVLRSSTGMKTNIRLANQVGIIDSDYRGELMLLLENYSSHIEVVNEGQRIAQLLIHKVEKFNVDVVSELTETERGSQGFGSTGGN